nr:unnamed protein product [Callosobruchus chinensis]
MPFSRYLTQKELEATVEEIMMEPKSDQSGEIDAVYIPPELELVVPDNTELPDQSFTLSTENPEWDDESLESKRRLTLSTNDRLASTVKWKKGYYTLPRIQHYWSTDEDKGIDLVKRCMSRNRFQSIKQNLHLSDNSILDKNDKFSKMNKWYITLAASKPVRFRFKLWCLCSSDGYIFYSIPYGVAQNQTHSNLGLGDILAPAIDEVRYDNQGHVMISHANKARRRCRVCHSHTVYICNKCNVHLHPSCSIKYHQK